MRGWPAASLGGVMELAIQVYTKRYFQFSGRASRPEFWLSALLLTIAYVGAGILDYSFGMLSPISWVGPIGWIVWIITLIPAVAVGVRRLHDSNRSGLWYLSTAVPVIGWVFFIVLACLPGTQEQNRFGTSAPTASNRT